MSTTPEGYPSPEFLLDAADRGLMAAYLSVGRAASPDLRKRACELEEHLDRLFDLEMLATARSQGLQRRLPGLYFDPQQTWPLLARPRRAVMAIGLFTGHASCEGLGQACADNEDLLLYIIEAIEVLAPQALADELQRYVQQNYEHLDGFQQNTAPDASAQPLWQGDPQSLEDRVWKTDWTAVCFQYMLENHTWFFLQPNQGSTRRPVPKYDEFEAEWRRIEKERVLREECEREIAADSRITELRCANCGMPSPGYRRSCKYCCKTVDRA